MNALLKILFTLTAITFVWSAINPHDYFTWFLEIFPVIIGSYFIYKTYNRFRLTDLTYSLLFIHAIILMMGGHYTYALVPAGNWAKDMLDLARNNYDRLGHLAQGFVPAMLLREIFIRNNIIANRRWMFILIVSTCLAFSAYYEIFEAAIAMFIGTASDSFLGTQGDVWDTQWDMFCALIGAVSALLLLNKAQDKQIKKIN